MEEAASVPPIPPAEAAVSAGPDVASHASPVVAAHDHAIDASRGFQWWSIIIAMGWLGTNLGLNVTNLPVTFMLKDQLKLDAAGVAGFLALGQFCNYIKPLAGLCTDSIPLWATRRRWYLLLSLLGTGVMWLVLPLVPRQYWWLLITYWVMYTTVVFTSTTLGGVMVEAGNRFNAAGRLTAQRIGCFRLGELGGNFIGGQLAQHAPFLLSCGLGGLLHLILVPLYWVALREPAIAKPNLQVWDEARVQFRALLRSRVLLAAAGMIFLIAAAPGFDTPLVFFQSDKLHFQKDFIGVLAMVKAATGFLAAGLYFYACRRLTLRSILVASVFIHAVGTLAYFWYFNQQTALIVSAIYGMTYTLSMLPVYDLATRGTPRGSEAIGYAVMMSVWNFTNKFSDWSGSALQTNFHLEFFHLILINAATTLLVLVALPFLPRALALSKDAH